MENNLEIKLNQMAFTDIPNNSNLNYHSLENTNNRIAQYDINGYIVQVYNKSKDLVKNGFNPKLVKMCLDGMQKTHKNFIFKRIENGKSPQLKINVNKYLPNINSTKNTNNLISDILNSADEFSSAVKTTKNNNCRIGIFLKNGKLVDVILSVDDIKNNPNYTTSLYDHLFHRVSKRGLRRGYKGKYYIHRLNKNETYTIGKNYDLKQFEICKQTRFIKNTAKKQKTEDLIFKPHFPPRTPKKEENNKVEIKSVQSNKISFWSRIKWIFTGNF